MKRTMATVMMVLLMATALQAGETQDSPLVNKQHSVGLGFGIPYGVLGTNADFGLHPNLSFSVGMGTTVLAGLGYNFGMKFFLNPPTESFRPRLSAYYGVNSMIVTETWGHYVGASNGQSFTGLTLGLGSQWMWGRSRSNGLDFDIMYIATTGADFNEMERDGLIASQPSRIKISIGYRRAF
jgi:hypothetical protein